MNKTHRCGEIPSDTEVEFELAVVEFDPLQCEGFFSDELETGALYVQTTLLTKTKNVRWS